MDEFSMPSNTAILNEVKKLQATQAEILKILKKNSEDEDENFDVAGASHYLKMKTATIYAKVSSKELPHFKIGKRLVFSRKDLDAYCLQRRRSSDFELQMKAEKF